MNEIKFCKDCKYFEKKTPLLPVPVLIPLYYLVDRCSNPKFTIVDLVNNGKFFPKCTDARSNSDQCGESGTYFEQRKSFWSRLFR